MIKDDFHMRVLFNLGILIVFAFLSSCNKQGPFVAVHEDQPIRYSSHTYYFNNAFHCFNRTSDYMDEPPVPTEVMLDSIEGHYRKLLLSINEQEKDSIWLVNYPSGLSQGRGADYVACLKGKVCTFDIYFPYDLEGTYTVELTDDEYLLFYGLLGNMLSKDEYEAPLVIDSIPSGFNDYPQLIYIKTYYQDSAGEYLKVIASSVSEEYVLNIYMMILLRSRISPSSFLDSVPRLNNVLDSYNSLLIGSSNSGFTKPEPPPPPPFDPTSDTEDLSILEEEL